MDWNDVRRYARGGNPEPPRRVEKTDDEWQEELDPEAYRILRQKGTERAFTGEYCEAHEAGLYACRGCGTPLFDSRQKFDSRSGWPSFTEPVRDDVIRYEEDRSHGMRRVEVLCNVCGGHQGHVFPDGPAPTGLRFCINSASLRRVDEEEAAQR